MYIILEFVDLVVDSLIPWYHSFSTFFDQIYTQFEWLQLSSDSDSDSGDTDSTYNESESDYESESDEILLESSSESEDKPVFYGPHFPDPRIIEPIVDEFYQFMKEYHRMLFKAGQLDKEELVIRETWFRHTRNMSIVSMEEVDALQAKIIKWKAEVAATEEWKMRLLPQIKKFDEQKITLLWERAVDRGHYDLQELVNFLFGPLVKTVTPKVIEPVIETTSEIIIETEKKITDILFDYDPFAKFSYTEEDFASFEKIDQQILDWEEQAKSTDIKDVVKRWVSPTWYKIYIIILALIYFFYERNNQLSSSETSFESLEDLQIKKSINKFYNKQLIIKHVNLARRMDRRYFTMPNKEIISQKQLELLDKENQTQSLCLRSTARASEDLSWNSRCWMQECSHCARWRSLEVRRFVQSYRDI